MLGEILTLRRFVHQRPLVLTEIVTA